jgi:hypothetical protein
MKTEDIKYEKVMKLIRDARPELKHSDIITEKVISKLKIEKSKFNIGELIMEFLFGWIYIAWIRRSMIVAAVSIAMLFGYQQTLILKKIDELSGQRIQNGSLFTTSTKDEVTDKLRLFRISGRRLSGNNISVSKEDIDEMIRSINKLQLKYKDVIDRIESDPELKKYLENRMKEIVKNRNQKP